MKNLLCYGISLLSLLLSHPLSAQVSLDWVKRYAFGQFTDLATDAAGNVYATGNFETNDSIFVMTVKLAPNGSLVWQKLFYSVPSPNNRPVALVLDESQGALYVAGATSTEFPNSFFNEDYLTLKYDLQGNQQWVRTFDGTAPGALEPSLERISHIGVDGTGNVYVTGISSGDYFNVYYDLVTISYAPDGTERWRRTYADQENAYDEPRAMKIDASGNLYLAGQVTPNCCSSYGLVFKYDSEGTLVWRHEMKGESPYQGSWIIDIALDHQGNVILVGGIQDQGGFTLKYTAAGSQVWKRYVEASLSLAAVDGMGNVVVSGSNAGSQQNAPPSDQENGLVTYKYTSQGNPLWSRTYGGPLYKKIYSSSATPSELVLDAAGNVYITGYQETPYGTTDDIMTFSYGPEGSPRWVQSYAGSHLTNFHRATALVVRADGQIYVAGGGYTNNFQRAQGVLLNYTQDGTPLPTTQTFWLEAECALVGNHWQTQTGSNQASNGSFVVRRGSYGYTYAFQPADYVSFAVDIYPADSFYFYARTKSLTSNSNSFWVRIDGGDWQVWNLPYGQGYVWSTLPLTPRNLNFGTHLIDVAYREPNTQLDKLYISTEPGIPVGFGEMASNCGVSPLRTVAAESAVDIGLRVQVYPNPVQDRLIIETDAPTHVRIYNALGVEVLSGQIEGQTQMPVHQLPKGIYFLHVEGQSAQRIVKQ
ncbi:Por secretion system C-terminal sorting domain-containing protein [Catalinimonas alkaloidigena]|uniref:Por secretion system C-terminal sorting domain-containing protein n=1 Tax=Catalinimonas alkaloidigena TaxID=1075417 RepID=A0A1G9UVQ6_9BACT|nr:T9SS type A sorting domain-containing protein [Catalinimonas alkaloidigena]SDM63998.1 Por secretion system C-terminal sorting domain-containing protein [Catalinimonas alkaloidigena]